MRAALTNTVFLNTGDAAIAEVALDAIRAAGPDVRPEVHDAQPEAAGRYYPELSFRPALGGLLVPRVAVPKAERFARVVRRRRLLAAASGTRPWSTPRERAALRDFRGLDAIVSTGGTYLVEQYDLTRRLFELDAAHRMGMRTIFFTQSLGPFTQPRTQEVLRRVMGASPLVLLRDDRSARHLEEIGVPMDSVHVVADSVFAMAPEDLGFPVRRAEGEPWRIGVSVRQWPSSAALDSPPVRRFVEAMADGLTRIAAALPVELTFLSTCQGAPEYWTDDSRVATAVHEALPPHVRARARVDAGFHTPQQFRERVRELDLMVSTRMHGAILALTAGTPVVPIAYEFKTREVAERLGIGRYTLDIDTIEGEALEHAVTGFTTELDALRGPLAEAVLRERARANHGSTLVADTLRGDV